MKTAKLICYLSIFIMSSCGSNKYVFKDSLILKKEKIYDSDNNLIKIKKEQLNLVLDNDTINESQYEFFLPKSSKSHESVVNSIPTIHLFSFSKNQYLVVLKIKKRIFEKDLLNIDKESFLSALERIGNIEYLIEDLKLSKGKKHNILIKNEVIYLIINKKDKNLFKDLME